MTKKKKCYFEISASFYLLSWSFPKICLSVCQKLRIFACERKNQRWKDMELMLIRKSGLENRPLTHHNAKDIDPAAAAIDVIMRGKLPTQIYNAIKKQNLGSVKKPKRR